MNNYISLGMWEQKNKAKVKVSVYTKLPTG